MTRIKHSSANNKIILYGEIIIIIIISTSIAHVFLDFFKDIYHLLPYEVPSINEKINKHFI